MCPKWSVAVLLFISLVNHNVARRSTTDEPEYACPSYREIVKCYEIFHPKPPPYKQWIDVTTADIVKENGILAGNYGGQDVYVGKGWYSVLQEPGKLTLEPSPALVFNTDSAAQYRTSNIQFLNKDPKCDYKWVPSHSGIPVTNAVLVPYYMTLMIGRKNVHGVTQVGKVGTIAPHTLFYYAHGNAIYHTPEYYEVLVCEPTNDHCI